MLFFLYKRFIGATWRCIFSLDIAISPSSVAKKLSIPEKRGMERGGGKVCYLGNAMWMVNFLKWWSVIPAFELGILRHLPSAVSLTTFMCRVFCVPKPHFRWNLRLCLVHAYRLMRQLFFFHLNPNWNQNRDRIFQHFGAHRPRDETNHFALWTLWLLSKQYWITLCLFSRPRAPFYMTFLGQHAACERYSTAVSYIVQNSVMISSCALPRACAPDISEVCAPCIYEKAIMVGLS